MKKTHFVFLKSDTQKQIILAGKDKQNEGSRERKPGWIRPEQTNKQKNTQSFMSCWAPSVATVTDTKPTDHSRPSSPAAQSQRRKVHSQTRLPTNMILLTGVKATAQSRPGPVVLPQVPQVPVTLVLHQTQDLLTWERHKHHDFTSTHWSVSENHCCIVLVFFLPFSICL